MNPSDFNQKGIYQKKLQVLPEYDDGFGRMKLQSVASVTSKTAYEHIQSNGLTDEIMESMQIYIVLVWSAFTFTRIPRVGEELTLYTWTGKARLGIYPRRTAVVSADGDLLLTCSSQWLLIDRANRRMDAKADISPYLQEIHIEGEPPLPPHRKKFPEQPAGHMTQTVQPYMIDFNHHMNNSWYFEWAENCLPRDFRKTHEPRTLWAEYRHELYNGETAQISWAQEGTQLYVRGKREEELSFSIVLNYEG